MRGKTQLNHKAFSLLELVLAVGLSVVLLALIGFAIDQHYFRLETGRTSIEQAALVRSVFAQIATDLRATTSAPEQDVEEQMLQAEEAALFDVDEVDQDLSEVEQTEETEVGVPPGVYGSLNELRLDFRLTQQRIEESPLGPNEPPVARVDAGWAHVRYYLVTTGDDPGLYRYEAPREEMLWSEEQATPLDAGSQIAEEVAAIRLRYFDGLEFFEEWDQAEREALPQAVEVVLDFYDEEQSVASNERQPVRSYRRLVLLPSASEENSEGATSDAEEIDTLLGESA